MQQARQQRAGVVQRRCRSHTNGNSIAHHVCHGSLSASGYMARQNAVGSAQGHSIVSLAQMSSTVPSGSLSTCYYVLPFLTRITSGSNHLSQVGSTHLLIQVKPLM